MAALAKQAVNALTKEKPHSSITDWVEILSSSRYEVEAYDGIPELVDSINIQSFEGTTEASRAIRKKLKHGNPHQQLRVLVILKALVENCGPNFQNNFADDRLLEAIKHLANNTSTDSAVRKKLLVVLASWKRQFEGDTKISSLFDQYKRGPRRSDLLPEEFVTREMSQQRIKEREEKEAAKREKEEAKEAKERAKKEKGEERRRQLREAKRSKRKPFNFEEEKPKVLNSIVIASQASSNLVNSLKLVNTEKEPVETNQRVQECLAAAKAARKQVVRYIQLVEVEEIIGTLLETNEHIINALELYDQYLIPDADISVESQLSRVTISEGNKSTSELIKLQEKQKAAVAKAQAQQGRLVASGSNVHPDLQDLDFGSQTQGLQAPLRPLSPDSEDNELPGRGSLSDYSDYESSDEETHNQGLHRDRSISPVGKGKAHLYRSFSNEGVVGEEDIDRQVLLDDSDPFADPEVGTPGIYQKKVTG